MPTHPEFETLSDDQLLASVRKIVARTNTGLADLLAHLGKVEARGIHRIRACASLYTYCVYELRMSEDEAYRRAKPARLVRQFPELFERVATGELHLTGLLLLGPHLDSERRQEILDCARFRSKREIQELVARLEPKPEVPSLVEPIGPAPAGPATHVHFVESLAAPVRSLPVGERPADWIEEAQLSGDSSEHEDTGMDTSFSERRNARRRTGHARWVRPVASRVQPSATVTSPRRYSARCGRGTRRAAATSTTKGGAARRPPGSSSTIACPTRMAVRTTRKISSFAAWRTTISRQNRTSGESTWRRGEASYLLRIRAGAGRFSARAGLHRAT